MTPITKRDLESFQQFRTELYALFPRRKDAIMNLLDSVCADGHRYKSVIQLSDSNCFERQYSSITDAIAEGLTESDWHLVESFVFKNYKENFVGRFHTFLLDCTSGARVHANKLADRSAVYHPNSVSGNKPITIGHQYSTVAALLPEESDGRWVAPISVRRVKSEEKGHEVSMKQLEDHIEHFGLKNELVLSVGDSLYSSQTCREKASKHANLVHICRLNSCRNVYAQPEQIPNKKGRKKEFGEKMQLRKASTHLPCEKETQIHWTTRGGKQCLVMIKAWYEMRMRGTQSFHATDHPFTLIQIVVQDQDGKAIYKHPLWLAVIGERRDEISLETAYQYYRGRFDIEHFFRFGKRNLMMDRYQTPEVKHEELWWKFCLLAYFQLFMSRSLTSSLPKPWERYLPENKTSSPHSPSKTQRGFSNLLAQSGSPAKKPVPRGRPVGRQAGEVQVKRQSHPPHFKQSKKQE